jgi:hypothetical protein
MPNVNTCLKTPETINSTSVPPGTAKIMLCCNWHLHFDMTLETMSIDARLGHNEINLTTKESDLH